MRVSLEHSTEYQSIVFHPTATAIQGWYLSQGAGKWQWVATLGLISKDCFLEAEAAFCEKGVLWGTGLPCVLAIMDDLQELGDRQIHMAVHLPSGHLGCFWPIGMK